MKYNREETVGLEILSIVPGFLIDFNKLYQEESDLAGASIPQIFPENSEVLNVDKMEVEFARIENRKRSPTTDTAFVIKYNNISEIVLVELRLNYKGKSIASLSTQKFIDKVNYTSELLGGKYNIHIYKFFIFSPNKVPMAKRFLYKLNPVFPQNYIATDIFKIKGLFF